MHITFIFHTCSIHIPGFGTRNRFPHYSFSPSLTESALLAPFPRSICVYFACGYLLRFGPGWPSEAHSDIFGSISMRTDSTQGSFNGHCKLAQELNISFKRCPMYSELFSFLWWLLFWGVCV